MRRLSEAASIDSSILILKELEMVGSFSKYLKKRWKPDILSSVIPLKDGG
jgi:hypothetical protein